MNKVCRSAVVVAGLVFTLGGAASWGQVPATNDTSGSGGNTGGGSGALGSPNLSGSGNTAYGSLSLAGNTIGYRNSAFGDGALQSNNTGNNNTALGNIALVSNADGSDNTASGSQALNNNTSGSDNTATGSALTSGNTNIYLGNPGVASESNTLRLGQVNSQTRTFMAGIFGKTASGGIQVVINSSGQLGTVVSAARYKRDIRDIGEKSQGLHRLRPVTFRYKQDPQGPRQYGLIAEEVATVYPELVVRGAKGEVEAVQYHELIPMLLNEVQHQQQELAELKAQNARLQATLVQQNAAVAARLEQLEAGAARAATLATR
jgi:Chaperone of endosialidase